MFALIAACDLCGPDRERTPIPASARDLVVRPGAPPPAPTQPRAGSLLWLTWPDGSNAQLHVCPDHIALAMQVGILIGD
jgi:hypothetical protein